MSSVNNPLKRSLDGSYIYPSSSHHDGTTLEPAKRRQSSLNTALKSDACQNRSKRPRTEKYQREFQRFESVQRTIQFFQQALGEPGEDEVITNCAAPSGFSALHDHDDLLSRNLESLSIMHRLEFQGRCRSWLDEAQERLDLKEAIASMRNSIYGIKECDKNQHQELSTLSLLNLGKETTERLIGSVAEYCGGIPSDCEVLDCHKLVNTIRQG
jgi:hypothetical protein